MSTTFRLRAIRRPATATLVHHAVLRNERPPQRPMSTRVIYALFVGWWLASYWALLGFILEQCRIPLGKTMLSQLSTIFCLERR